MARSLLAAFLRSASPDGVCETPVPELSRQEGLQTEARLPQTLLPRDPSFPAGPASPSAGWGLSLAEGPRVLGVSLPLLL